MASDLALLVISVIIRVLAVQYKWFFTRPEVSTPLNSWLRLTEGVHLYNSGFSPYSGVLFHETPLALVFFSLIGCDKVHNTWLFVAADIITGCIMFKIGEVVARDTLLQEDAAVSSGQYHTESRSMLTSLGCTVTLPRALALAYLLNPYTISSCAALTTTVWTNLLLATFMYSLVNHNLFLGCLSLALATYQSLYPALLLVPFILSLYQQEPSAARLIKVLGTFLVMFSSLQIFSFRAIGDWSYLHSVYGFILTVPELTPNMGIFWYFFTEMFDHFRVFFICTFQINLLLYVAPLSIKFPDQPLLLSSVIVGLIAVFKSYPGLGDVGFFLSLLPLFSKLLPFMKQTFLIICMLFATSVLAPIAWQLWIYNNSANANYYFAINLVYSSAQIFLITDLLFGHVKREFYLKNGFSMLDKEDEKGQKPILNLR